MKIWIVEDCVDLGRLWSRLFELAGHQVEVFRDAVSLLSQINQLSKPDVLLTDYYLPDRNGLDLIHELRSREFCAPCAVVTGSREKSVADSMRHSGVRFLTKPVKFNHLEQIVHELVSGTL